MISVAQCPSEGAVAEDVTLEEPQPLDFFLHSFTEPQAEDLGHDQKGAGAEDKPADAEELKVIEAVPARTPRKRCAACMLRPEGKADEECEECARLNQAGPSQLSQ
jgi:hypothetical protein